MIELPPSEEQPIPAVVVAPAVAAVVVLPWEVVHAVVDQTGQIEFGQVWQFADWEHGIVSY